jgi:hypothetical protein
VEIKDQGKVPVLKFWCGGGPFGRCRLGQRPLLRDWPKPVWPTGTTRGKRGRRRECERSQGSRGGSKGVGTNRECAPEPTDSVLTAVSRISDRDSEDGASGCEFLAARCGRAPHVELWTYRQQRNT